MRPVFEQAAFHVREAIELDSLKWAQSTEEDQVLGASHHVRGIDLEASEISDGLHDPRRVGRRRWAAQTLARKCQTTNGPQADRTRLGTE